MEVIPKTFVYTVMTCVRRGSDRTARGMNADVLLIYNDTREAICGTIGREKKSKKVEGTEARFFPSRTVALLQSERRCGHGKDGRPGSESGGT